MKDMFSDGKDITDIPYDELSVRDLAQFRLRDIAENYGASSIVTLVSWMGDLGMDIDQPFALDILGSIMLNTVPSELNQYSRRRKEEVLARGFVLGFLSSLKESRGEHAHSQGFPYEATIERHEKIPFGSTYIYEEARTGTQIDGIATGSTSLYALTHKRGGQQAILFFGHRTEDSYLVPLSSNQRRTLLGAVGRPEPHLRVDVWNKITAHGVN